MWVNQKNAEDRDKEAPIFKRQDVWNLGWSSSVSQWREEERSGDANDGRVLSATNGIRKLSGRRFTSPEWVTGKQKTTQATVLSFPCNSESTQTKKDYLQMNKNRTTADLPGINLQGAKEKWLNLEFCVPLKYYSSLEMNKMMLQWWLRV